MNPSPSPSGPSDQATGGCTPPLVSVWVVDYCSGRTGVTEFPLATEEHSPGVGCMQRRETQTPIGQNNCHRGERGGVGKEELEKG